MDPIVLTCGRVRQTFDVPPNRAGETCHCPYCGDLHYVPKPWMRRLAKRDDLAGQARPKAARRGAATDVSRFKYVLVGSCGVLVGVLAGSGLTELSYDRSASVLLLEKRLEKANEEKQQAIEARDEAESLLAAAHDERRRIERERDEARRRIGELQAGLEDAVRRLSLLRQK